METFYNNGNVRYFIERNVNRTLVRDSIPYRNLRRFHRSTNCEVLKLKHSDEHSASEIIFKGININYMFLPHSSKWQSSSYWDVISTDAVEPCHLYFVSLSSCGYHRVRPQYNLCYIPGKNANNRHSTLQLLGSLPTTTRNCKTPIVYWDRAQYDVFANSLSKCQLHARLFCLPHCMKRRCKLLYGLQQNDKPHIFEWMRHTLIVPTTLRLDSFWSWRTVGGDKYDINTAH